MYRKAAVILFIGGALFSGGILAYLYYGVNENSDGLKISLGFGILLIVIGISELVYGIKISIKKRRLKKSWIPILLEIECLKETGTVIDSAREYCLKVKYKGETFLSEEGTFQTFNKGEVMVYFDQDDPKKYWIDLDSIVEKSNDPLPIEREDEWEDENYNWEDEEYDETWEENDVLYENNNQKRSDPKT